LSCPSFHIKSVSIGLQYGLLCGCLAGAFLRNGVPLGVDSAGCRYSCWMCFFVRQTHFENRHQLVRSNVREAVQSAKLTYRCNFDKLMRTLLKRLCLDSGFEDLIRTTQTTRSLHRRAQQLYANLRHAIVSRT
jgi:hypothetical protein